jgi:AAA ATPase domain
MLERDGELSLLADAVQAAAAGRGSVVLVAGEAGIGKSSLVEAVRARLPAEGRMFVGYCDDLATPRTLGPFRDLVGSVGAELSRAVTDGHDRDRLLSALHAELDWAEHPAVLVIEDVHWADDATLDALRYLTRRIAALPAVLVLTYRDDEIGRGHALTGLLGQAARSEDVRRLPLRRLTADAVRRLSAGSAVNPADLFELTAGNPFFVTELLASARLAGAAGEPVPPSVTDAVLARVRRLDPPVQEMLEQLAVVTAAPARWLVDALAGAVVADVVAALSDAEQAQLLQEYAVECYTVGVACPAVDAMTRAVELNRTLGDPAALGASLRWLSRMHWWAGDRARAEQAGAEAVQVLEMAGPPRLLAIALRPHPQSGRRRRDLDDRRALRGRQRRRQPQPGRPGLLLHLPLRAERAVPGRRLLPRCPGRRGTRQAAGR